MPTASKHAPFAVDAKAKYFERPRIDLAHEEMDRLKPTDDDRLRASWLDRGRWFDWGR